MANMTTCTKCGDAYEARSDDQANERHRWCRHCRKCVDCGATNDMLGVCSSEHGPLCSECVKTHNRKHARETTRMFR